MKQDDVFLFIYIILAIGGWASLIHVLFYAGRFVYRDIKKMIQKKRQLDKNKLMKEHVESALEYLPESPDKAMDFLKHALDVENE